MNSPLNRRSRVASAAGFTLIEVLVSLIILSVGLLGLGLLQASSLKSSFSANQGTVQTNLAYQMIDMMRANRRLAFRYAYIDKGDAAAFSETTCNRHPSTGDIVADDSNGWMCQLRRELPDGDADVALKNGVATVVITWTDARWLANAADQKSTFAVSSQL